MIETYRLVSEPALGFFGIHERGIPATGTRVLRLCDDGSVAEERSASVIVQHNVRSSVAFVYGRDPQRDDYFVVGTAYLVSEPSAVPHGLWIFLVTARHVVEQIRARRNDGNVYLRFNEEASSYYFALPFSVWFFHPNEDAAVLGDEWLNEPSTTLRYDVAVAPCPPSALSRTMVAPFPLDTFVDQAVADAAHIQAGDDVIITGLYHQHVGKDRNIPIIRSGMIAAMPEEPVATRLGPMTAYLIETRSTGGLSGSPVTWHSGAFRPKPSGEWEPVETGYFRHLGLIQGHYDSRIDAEKLNDGIAIVVPAIVIRETLHQEAVMANRKAAEKRHRESESGPTMDSIASADESESVSLAPADPEDVLRALLRTPPHGQTQDPA